MSKTLRVLITGPASGIGMATAQVLAKRGHSVVATDVSALSGSEGMQAHVLDVTSDDSVARKSAPARNLISWATSDIPR